jgi:hypothetical protein
VQLGQEFADFADTAAVMAMLDLVISVDTSVAHLAGAMGKATALLVPFSPDWRSILDRTDRPWYPTMRLFRRAALGDWDGPLARLRQELTASLRAEPPGNRQLGFLRPLQARLTASGWPCRGLGAAVRPDAP